MDMMCTCMCVCVHVYIYIYIYIHAKTIHINISVYIYMCVYICMRKQETNKCMQPKDTTAYAAPFLLHSEASNLCLKPLRTLNPSPTPPPETLNLNPKPY